MAAGVEGVRGGGGVQVEARLAAQPERHVGALGAAHGALALAALALLAVVAPVVVAVHVAALQVHPRLLLVRRVLAPHGGEGQRVEAHGALRPRRVDLLPQRLQVLEGGGAREALGGAPQQGGAAEVHQGAVHQLMTLGLHLEGGLTCLNLLNIDCIYVLKCLINNISLFILFLDSKATDYFISFRQFSTIPYLVSL